MGQASVNVEFERRRAVLWVCDIQGSSSALNNPKAVEAAEEFLKRFFWLSTILLSVTGSAVAKSTGDGFLAAYDLPLERDIDSTAKMALEAAWQLSFLVNITQLGVPGARRLRIRHGLAYEPDAILVRHQVGTNLSTDVIGRGVVLAFRLSGVPAPFPGVVVQKRLLVAARGAGFKQAYRKRSLSRDEILKYFKGERWSTTGIWISSEHRPRPDSGHSAALRRARVLVSHIESANPAPTPDTWLARFLRALDAGPAWSRDVGREWAQFVERDLLGTLKRVLTVLETHSRGAAQPALAAAEAVDTKKRPRG